MTTQEEFEELMKNKAKEYFEKHIIGKDIESVVYEISKDVLFKMTSNLCIFKLYSFCLDIIKDDKNYFEKLKKEQQEMTTETILAIEAICKNIENILEPIAEELSA